MIIMAYSVKNLKSSITYSDSCIAKKMWVVISEIVGKNVGTDFESVARWWLSDNKFKILNVCTTCP
jgi:hypothetical protein